MKQIFVDTLIELAKNDPTVMLLTADLGFNMFEEFEARFPKQFINVGICEQNMIGVATGLAMSGKKIFAYSIANFATLRCLEQIRLDACYHELNINIVAMGGGFSYGTLGVSHHATEDISIMRALPGVTVMVPSTESDVRNSTQQLVNTKGVGYLRLEREAAVENANEVSSVWRRGEDVLIVATGSILSEAVKASDLLKSKNITSTVINICKIKPMDISLVIPEISKHKILVTVEENNNVGGFGTAIIEALIEQSIYPNKMIRIGIPDLYLSAVGKQTYLRETLGLDSIGIANKIYNALTPK